jgi:hypothetical protein
VAQAQCNLSPEQVADLAHTLYGEELLICEIGGRLGVCMVVSSLKAPANHYSAPQLLPHRLLS